MKNNKYNAKPTRTQKSPYSPSKHTIHKIKNHGNPPLLNLLSNPPKKNCHPSSKSESPPQTIIPSRKHPRPRPTPRPPARGALIPHQLHLPMRILLQLHRRTRQQQLLPLLLQLPFVFKQLVLKVLVDPLFDDDEIRIVLTVTSSASLSLLYSKKNHVCVAGRETEGGGGEGGAQNSHHPIPTAIHIGPRCPG